MALAGVDERKTRGGLQPLSLRVNFSWTLAGNVFYAASQWAIVATIAKLGSPAMVGQFSLALAITAPVFMFTNLGLRGVQATDAKEDFDFWDYAFLRVATTIFGLLIVGIILLFSEYDPSLLLIVGVVGVAKASDSMSDVCYGLMQQRERMDPIARSMILRGGSSLVLLAVLLALSNSLLLAVAGMAFSWIVVFALHDVRKVRPFLPHQRAPTWFALDHSDGAWQARLSHAYKLALLALPLGFVMMLISLNVNVPRYFVEAEFGEEALGFYSALAYLTIAATTVVNALGQAAAPWLAQRYAAQDRKEFVVLLYKLIGIALALGLCGWLVARFLGGPVLTLLYTAEYASYTDLFAWFMAMTTGVLVSSVLGYAMTAMRRFRVQLPIFVAVVAVNVACCAWLIPQIGLTGAVWALIAATLVQGLASLGVVLNGLRHLTNTTS